ncbi:MAG: hypothetical protein ISS66_09805 [Desulfobacteraceae bacterium]|nr:hypothetical protein [Desulfobacteraceae bacterium]
MRTRTPGDRGIQSGEADDAGLPGSTGGILNVDEDHIQEVEAMLDHMEGKGKNWAYEGPTQKGGEDNGNGYSL